MTATTSPRSPGYYEFGPFRLVPAERVLLRDDHVVHLTPKAYDTLVALVQHRGRLLSKPELLGLIWPDTVVEENNLTQAICAIRKALGGSDDTGEYIETMPKLGYRFVAAVRTDDEEPVAATAAVRKLARPLVLALFVVLATLVGLRQGWWHLPRREPARSVDPRHTASAQAYQDYLDGLGSFNKRTDPSLRAAIFYFERAIEQDSSYAVAYAALADCYVLLGLYNATPQEVLPKAETAALKAVQLDSTSAEAHTALAAIDAFYRWDWPRALKEFQRAIQLSPDYPLAHHWYGVAYLVPMGDYQQALLQLTQARRLESQSLVIQTDLGWVYYVMRHYDRAIAEYDSVIRRNASFVPAHYLLSLTYERWGRYPQALAELHKAVTINSSWAAPVSKTAAGDVLGYRDGLRLLIAPAAIPEEGHAGLYAGALAYMRLGEPERALMWLQFAYRQRDPGLVYLNADPLFDGLRTDPAFRELTRRVGLAR